MDDRPMSPNLTNPVIIHPLSPELSNSRSFRRNLKSKNKSRTNKKDDLNQAVYKKEDSGLSDFPIEKETTNSPTEREHALNELDSILKMEQHRKSLYDRLSFSNKISVFKEATLNSNNPSQNVKNLKNFSSLKTTEQLEFANTNIKVTSTNRPLTNIDNISENKNLSDNKLNNLDPCQATVPANSMDDKTVIKEGTNSFNNSFKGAKASTFVSNSFKGEHFSDLDTESKFPGFSNVSLLTKIQQNVVKPSAGFEECTNVNLSKDNNRSEEDDNGLKMESNIFENEDFSDLKLCNNFDGFQKASLVIEPKQVDVRIQEGKGPKLNNINVRDNFSTSTGDNTDKNNSKMNIERPPNKNGKLRNIFKDENLSDLEVSNNSFGGFQSAAYFMRKSELNGPIGQHNNKIDPTKENNLETDIEKPSSDNGKLENIFKDENLGDLKLSSNDSSQTAAITVKNQKQKLNIDYNSTIGEENLKKNIENPANKNDKSKNIFENENFSDLKVSSSCSGFQSAATCIKKFELNKPNFKHNSEENYDRISENNVNINIEKTVTEISESNNILKDEDLSDLNELSSCIDFQNAAITLKKPKLNGPIVSNVGENMTLICENSIISSIEKNVEAIKRKAENIFGDESFGDLKISSNYGGFQSAGVTLKKSKHDLNKDDSIAKQNNNSINNENASIENEKDISGQSNAANNTRKNVMNIFKDIDLSDISPLKTSFNNSKLADGFNSRAVYTNIAKSKSLENNKYLQKKNVSNIFKDIDLRDITPVRQTNPFKVSRIPNGFRSGTVLTNVSNLFLEKRNSNKTVFRNTSILEGQNSNNYEPSYDKIEEFNGFSGSDQALSINLGMNFCQNVGKTDEFLTTKNEELLKSLGTKRKLSGNDIESPTLKRFKSRFDENQSFIRKPQKRLGGRCFPSIVISSSDLEKATNLFREELSVHPLETSTPIPSKYGINNCGVTPNKFMNLTPIREESSNFSKVSTRLFFENEPSNVTLTDKPIVPKQFCLTKPTEGNVHNWLENLEAERRLLEQRLRVVCERHSILESQEKQYLDRQVIRKQPGLLYMEKSQANRCSLKSIEDPGSRDGCTNHFFNMINPQNACLVHFDVPIGHTSMKTTDGAEIVPNSKGQIGLSEIEHSFNVMPGVDPKLISEGWIKNHYKWIVWKLASYERMYPEKFEGILCLDSVVQQLKYRYDREIDKVERSALKKIFEKDDSSKKRLALCVSNIRKVNNKDYELELTDGWYSIRATIDKPLSNHISKGKLKIGTKLVICCAEMLNNNDGCDPLEASSSICLNISYNSTRRAAWWAKLGYQKDPSAIRIPLSTISLEGGKIGCIQFYVARVYPVKYLEKFRENNNVWRNYKAEERKAQSWEIEQSSKLEKLMSNIDENAESQCDSPVFVENIEFIDDPEILHKILRTSKDPEKINEMLSSSQRASLMAYQLNKSSKEQSRLMSEMQKKASNNVTRNVTPLLRLRLLDASGMSDQDHNFYVWDPQQYHLNILKEGEVVSAFNVACSTNWGLSANKTTKFKEEPKRGIGKFEKFERKITRIDEINRNYERLVFKEFDTVGIVVKISVGSFQQLWLASLSHRLLSIRIYESPENVLLLDGIKEGDIAIVCNIIFKESKEDYDMAVADFYSVISKYSKFKHLERETRIFNEEMEKMDSHNFIQVALAKIGQIEKKSSSQKTLSVWNSYVSDDGMDSSQLTTTDIALLECVSKLEA